MLNTAMSLEDYQLVRLKIFDFCETETVSLSNNISQNGKKRFEDLFSESS